MRDEKGWGGCMCGVFWSKELARIATKFLPRKHFILTIPRKTINFFQNSTFKRHIFKPKATSWLVVNEKHHCNKDIRIDVLKQINWMLSTIILKPAISQIHLMKLYTNYGLSKPQMNTGFKFSTGRKTLLHGKEQVIVADSPTPVLLREQMHPSYRRK